MIQRRHWNRVVAAAGAVLLLVSFVTEIAALLLAGFVLLAIGLANDERWSGRPEG